MACIWIFASWAICIGLRPPVASSLASLAPGVRLMAASLAVGLCAGWPLLRLSGPRERWPIMRVLVDLLTLAYLTQVVLWPLRLATPWPPERLALMDALLFGWALVVGAITAAASRSSDGRARATAMAACLIICVLGLPMGVGAASLGLAEPPIWLQGPVLAVLALGSESGSLTLKDPWSGAIAVAASGVIAMLAAWRWIRRMDRLVAAPHPHG
jgi:hypothetical protein